MVWRMWIKFHAFFFFLTTVTEQEGSVKSPLYCLFVSFPHKRCPGLSHMYLWNPWELVFDFHFFFPVQRLGGQNVCKATQLLMRPVPPLETKKTKNIVIAALQADGCQRRERMIGGQWVTRESEWHQRHVFPPCHHLFTLQKHNNH